MALQQEQIQESIEEGDHMALTQPTPDVDDNFIYQLMASNLTLGPILDMNQGSWTMAEIEEAWAAYRAKASAMYRRSNTVAHAPPDAPQAVLDYQAKLNSVQANVVEADTLALDIPPLAREELETRITILGRGRKNPQEVKELKQALRKGGDKLRVSTKTAMFVYEELLDAKKVLTSPGMANDPTFAYHLIGIKQALKNMRQLSGSMAKGPASAILDMVEETREALLGGAALDLEEVQSLVEASAAVLRAKKGKCPEDGCVVKRGGNWRVVSNKTGKLWDAKYDTKKDAKDAIAAYHIRKGA